MNGKHAKSGGPMPRCPRGFSDRHRTQRQARGESDDRYGFTVRYVRCDRCLVAYSPQHVHRVRRWTWWCDNCIHSRHGHGSIVDEPLPRAIHRYKDDPVMQDWLPRARERQVDERKWREQRRQEAARQALHAELDTAIREHGVERVTVLAA